MLIEMLIIENISDRLLNINFPKFAFNEKHIGIKEMYKLQ